MNKINFAIVLHFHQPIGNFENVIERAYQFCYKPFFELLFQYPEIKLTIHISGCLLDFLEKKHPEIIELLQNLLCRRQIEIMGGAYYEPILVAIPDRDILSQIRMMSGYLQERFNYRPQGMWIPERVWEARLVTPIYEAGMRYSILDDTHFLNSGVKKEDTYGFFLTRKANEKIAVFPSDKTLRYMIPFELPHKIIDYFKSTAEHRENLIFSYGDDGEKFGEWPGTHKWVFEEHWLKNFFELLLQNNSWIKLVKLSEYLENNKPSGEIDINAGSYDELLEWSGGSWVNFLTKYPEANQMQKKMLYVSNKIEKIANKGKRENLERIETARKELYRGQCNCAYWHGVFGGLYLYHLRSAVYQHLITADKISDGILHKTRENWLDREEIDFDLDGKDEIVIENETFSIYIDPNEGGVIKEIDYKPLSFNLVNTLSRKAESYHQKMLTAREGSLEHGVKTIHDDIREVTKDTIDKLIYDRFPRYCLRDHFIGKDVKIEDFYKSAYEELGNFATATYKIKKKNRIAAMEYESEVSGVKLRLSKQVKIGSKREIEISYLLEKKDRRPFESVFGIEFNLTMPWLNDRRYNYFCDNENIAALDARGKAVCLSTFSISDSLEELGVRFQFSRGDSDIWYFPVETVSQSERAYELNYQCSCIFPKWKIDLKKDKNWDLKIGLSVV